MKKRTTGRRIPEKGTADFRKAVKRAKKADKKVAKAIEKGEHGRITPGNAKKIIGVAKVVGPVLLPFALRAASAARERYERMRARRLGVPVDDLGKFTGRGAALHARIAGDTDALHDLRAQSATSEESSLAAEQYAERTGARLEQLTSAVRAAERMPTQRRKSTHRAVNAELGQIEDDLLTHFGVTKTGRLTHKRKP
ncbi:DUF6474 family protein [Saccharopolyspora phatthalungensis]|uniref:Uncharacterized protein n=1 Tax=Saccharopolyspora phatthalungensis TaxID=664693 RepID=A0A840Q2T2_9PSEU|nr:DUF6474 family protein [Saccharopolyspora phatthalungensis]MBB5154240.1 hypothetical protein [Saccharopolyspora phatthalungensis]